MPFNDPIQRYFLIKEHSCCFFGYSNTLPWNFYASHFWFWRYKNTPLCMDKSSIVFRRLDFQPGRADLLLRFLQYHLENHDNIPWCAHRHCCVLLCKNLLKSQTVILKQSQMLKTKSNIIC